MDRARRTDGVGENQEGVEANRPGGIFGGQFRIESAAGSGTDVALVPRVTYRETGERTGGSAPPMKERSESLVDESDGRVLESDDQTGTPLEPVDSVQEADEESFPASDAPSSWAGGGRLERP